MTTKRCAVSSCSKEILPGSPVHWFNLAPARPGLVDAPKDIYCSVRCIKFALRLENARLLLRSWQLSLEIGVLKVKNFFLLEQYKLLLWIYRGSQEPPR